MQYTEQQFNLPTMEGLSEKQIGVHLKLYAGYVKNVNAIMSKLDELKEDAEKNSIAIAEIRRRFGFEFDGMRLHELYFEALGGNGQMSGTLADALTKQWGSVDAWLADFKGVGTTRGIGWTLLTYDPKGEVFHNVWVGDHELGHLATLPILIAMDMWEHAFMVDYLPSEKGDYVSAFLKNLNWETLNDRFTHIA